MGLRELFISPGAFAWPSSQRFKVVAGLTHMPTPWVQARLTMDRGSVKQPTTCQLRGIYGGIVKRDENGQIVIGRPEGTSQNQ